MKHKLFFYLFICFGMPTLIWVDDAFAYLNFAAGSALIHGLIAGIVGGIFLIKVYWNKLKKLFSPRGKGDTSGRVK